MSYNKSVCSVCKFHKKIIISLFSSTWPINHFQFVEESCNLVLFLNIFSKILCCFIFYSYFCNRPSLSRSGREGHNIDDVLNKPILLAKIKHIYFVDFPDAIEVLLFKGKSEISVNRRFALSSRFYFEFKKMFEKWKSHPCLVYRWL